MSGRWLWMLVLSLAWTAPLAAQERTAPTADEYTQRVQRGVELLAAGDHDGAGRAFQEAIGIDGGRPQAQFHLAVAHRMANRLDEAVTSFRQAAALAQSVNEPRWQARALHGVASTLERIGGRPEEVRAGWEAFVRFADEHAAVADPQIGRARLQALDAMVEQETVYTQVRQRIAEREVERQREAERPRRRPAR